jgi:hypothetical protein
MRHQSLHQQETAEQAGLAADGAAEGGTGLHLPVRALVLPLQLHGEDSSKQLISVTLEWSCPGVDAKVEAGLASPGKTLGSVQMRPVGRLADGSSATGDLQQQASTAAEEAAAGPGMQPYELQQPQVFAAAVPMTRQQLVQSCGSSSSSSAAAGVVLLQVVVMDDAGGVSTSELRPIVLSSVSAATASSGLTSHSSSAGARGGQGQQESAAAAAAAAAAGDPTPEDSGSITAGLMARSAVDDEGSQMLSGHLPLPSHTAERLLLTFDGPAFSVRLFFAGWLAQVVGLLLLPR